MFNGACSRNCSAEARCLGDQPISHVAAVAVSPDGEMLRISDPVFNQCIYTFEDVLAWPRDDLRNDPQQELVAVAGRPAVIWLKHQPALGRRQPVPLVPIGFEVIAIRIRRSAVDEDEHGKTLLFEFSWWIHQHPLDS